MVQKELNIGLALSGGGVRAAVFHLGILGRLADENLVEKVKMISTVSGGSLVAGLIYHANGYKWPNSKEYKEKCIPYVKECLTKKNLQVRALIRLPMFWLLIKKGSAIIYAGAIENCWNIRCKLNDIPIVPRWNINATSIESGKSWRFVSNNRMGDYILNYVENPDFKLSEALCCSAAVPIAIGPFKLQTSDYQWFKYDKNENRIEVKPTYDKIHLWDGGTYDNLGTESLTKIDNGLKYRKEINYLVVSDAAGTLHTVRRKWYNPIRLIDVTMDQVRALRARILFDHFSFNKDSGTYLKIGESVDTIYKNIEPSFPIDILTRTGLNDTDILSARDYPTSLCKMKIKDFDNLFKHGWEVANSALVCRSHDLFINQQYTY